MVIFQEEHVKRISVNLKNYALIFLHLPKTGGTTLSSLLKKKYKKSEAIVITNPQARNEFYQLPLAKRASIKYLHGHNVFGFHEYLPTPSHYITLLRNPIDRVVSHYYYVLRRPDHYLHETVVDSNIELEEYVASGISPEINNGQVRLLSTISCSFGNCSQEMLEQAKNNLSRHFSAIGTLEDFDKFLLLLKKKLSWNGYPLYRRKNVTSKRPSLNSLSASAIKTIEKHNQLDIEMYEFVKHEFHKNYDFYCTEADLTRFQWLNANYNRVRNTFN